MARPQRHNADYFSHDSDMRNDQKINAIRNKFGLEGYAVWNMILEVLTHQAYFEYPWDELSIELLASDFRVSVEKLTEISEYSIKLKLLTVSEDVIFSQNHKDRFTSLLGKRDRDRESKSVFVDENTNIVDEKGVFAAENTQSILENRKLNNNEIISVSKSPECDSLNIEFYPFLEFWNDYDKKVGDKIKLQKKWEAVKLSDRKLIKEFIPKYKESQPDKKYRKDPSTFLNNKSWNDEIILNNNKPKTHPTKLTTPKVYEPIQ